MTKYFIKAGTRGSRYSRSFDNGHSWQLVTTTMDVYYSDYDIDEKVQRGMIFNLPNTTYPWTRFYADFEDIITL